jgi:hypothetical protein
MQKNTAWIAQKRQVLVLMSVESDTQAPVSAMLTAKNA